jgi:hypothetical protein
MGTQAAKKIAMVAMIAARGIGTIWSPLLSIRTFQTGGEAED